MPLGIFGKKKPPKDAGSLVQSQQTNNDETQAPHPNNDTAPSTPGKADIAGNGSAMRPAVARQSEPQAPRPKLVFHCQQAQGSPTGIISGFTNVKELYEKIAHCYELKVSDILFCTLNTHKVDMGRLLGGQIGLEDFIFVHIKGQPKEVEVTKSEDALGLTITDNGAGIAFIKRIKEGSIMHGAQLVSVGDHIEKLDDKSLVGARHFEVAKMLKEIPKGSTFKLRLIEPLKSGFSVIDRNSSGKRGSSSVGTGKQTLRLRSKGPATVEVAEDVVNVAVDKINGLLESFMGINDTELSQTIWEIGSKKDNPHDFAVALDDSELSAFGFTDDFVFDLWGAISDAKQGRLNKGQEFNEQF